MITAISFHFPTFIFAPVAEWGRGCEEARLVQEYRLELGAGPKADGKTCKCPLCPIGVIIFSLVIQFYFHFRCELLSEFRCFDTLISFLASDWAARCSWWRHVELWDVPQWRPQEATTTAFREGLGAFQGFLKKKKRAQKNKKDWLHSRFVQPALPNKSHRRFAQSFVQSSRLFTRVVCLEMVLASGTVLPCPVLSPSEALCHLACWRTQASISDVCSRKAGPVRCHG